MPHEGRLAIVGCPVLEDEIVYLLSKDAGLEEVFVVEDDHSRNLLRKLCPIRSGVQRIKETDIEDLPSSKGRSVLVWMKSMGLHEEPKELGAEVARAVKRLNGKCSVVLLFYGLCGNAFKDMNLLFEGVDTPVVILTDEKGQTVDDCIAVPLGGTDGYLRLLKRYAGVFYMTPAWAENWPDLIDKMDITKGTEMGNLDMLKMLFEMTGYCKVLRIDTGLGDRENFHDHVRKFSKEFNFQELDLETDLVSTKVSDDAYRKCLELVENGNK
ncbi:MAG: DUF1638 domain-containing protein [Methanomassiliicoccus sp.]|nr:MAG: DUF1638 domain-containing protein [Methanomassiliicoccus sp.]